MTKQHEAGRAARGARLTPGELVRQSIRMTTRDWRAGELTLLVLALVLAVAALTSVGFLADRLRQGLERDARQMLGADFVVRADHPVDPSFAAAARADGLATASTAIFPSMVGGSGARRAVAARGREGRVGQLSAARRGSRSRVPRARRGARPRRSPRPAPCGPIRRCSTRCT